MKITNPEVIKGAEQELIDAVTAELDWGVIEEVIKKEHNLEIEEDVEYKKGDIVAINNRVAYNLQFEVKLTLSVLVDREGNYISVTSSGISTAPRDSADQREDEEPEAESTKVPGHREGEYEEALSELGSIDSPQEPHDDMATASEDSDKTS